MKTKSTKTAETRAVRQRKIAANKECAKQWAIARRARSSPIPVAKETKSKSEAKAVIATLQGRRAQLLKELAEIDVTLNVIQKTYK